MRKFVIKYKHGIITFAIIFIILYLCFSVLFKSFYFRPISLSNYVDNTYYNTGSCFLGDAPKRSKDSIYFRADAYGHFPKAGIYNITSNFTSAVYLERFSYKSETLNNGDFVYNNMLCYNSPSYEKIERKYYLDCLDYKSGERKHYLELNCPLNEKPSHAFTLEGNLYFETEQNSDLSNAVIYRYSEKGCEKVLSEDFVGKKYYVDQYYKNYIYLTNVNMFDLDIKIKEITIDKYDVNKRSVIQTFTIPVNQSMVNEAEFRILLLTDNYAFIEYQNTDKSMLKSIFKYNTDSGNFEKVLQTKENFVINAYNDNAYLALETGGIYSLFQQSNKFKKISDSKVNSISILDDKWLYYEGEDYHLYRIMPDGSKTEKVF